MLGNQIGVVYHPDFLLHTQEGHPERKERLEAIYSMLQQERYQLLISMLEPKYAEIEEIAMVHHQDYIAQVETACEKNQGFLDMDTYIVPQSYQIALLSAGATITGLKTIMEGNYQKVFSLGRPPGHHAEKNRAMGFCLFNNIAIAARVAQKDYGFNRIAIVDWDVHHGNGTQNTFYDEAGVLFISLHQSPAFPGTGKLDEVGSGEGEGYTVNIPLPGGCQNHDYYQVFQQVVIPILREYRPELVMISSGYDSHHQDPLAGMLLTEDGYHGMASALKKIAEDYAQERMLLCLEGGYNLQALANSVGNVIEALNQKEDTFQLEQMQLGKAPSAEKRIEQVLQKHSSYWDSLK